MALQLAATRWSRTRCAASCVPVRRGQGTMTLVCAARQLCSLLPSSLRAAAPWRQACVHAPHVPLQAGEDEGEDEGEEELVDSSEEDEEEGNEYEVRPLRHHVCLCACVPASCVCAPVPCGGARLEPPQVQHTCSVSSSGGGSSSGGTAPAWRQAGRQAPALPVGAATGAMSGDRCLQQAQQVQVSPRRLPAMALNECAQDSSFRGARGYQASAQCAQRATLSGGKQCAGDLPGSGSSGGSSSKRLLSLWRGGSCCGRAVAPGVEAAACGGGGGGAAAALAAELQTRAQRRGPQKRAGRARGASFPCAVLLSPRCPVGPAPLVVGG